MPYWKDGTLAFVHACGSPDPTRSHFDAQDFMENGTPGVKIDQRRMDESGARRDARRTSPTEALSLGATVPRILAGQMAVANMPLGRGCGAPDADWTARSSRPHSIGCTRQRCPQPNLSAGRDARAHLMSELEQDMKEANGGAPSPQGFQRRYGPPRAADSARPEHPASDSSRSADGTRTSTRAAPRGQLAGHLKPLGEGLAHFADRAGPRISTTRSSWSFRNSAAPCGRTGTAAPTMGMAM